MTSKAWKAWEGRLCKIFGGKRRGADYVDEHGKGKNCLLYTSDAATTPYV